MPPTFRIAELESALADLVAAAEGLLKITTDRNGKPGFPDPQIPKLSEAVERARKVMKEEA